MTESNLLVLFLSVAFVLAPLMANRFFFGGSWLYSIAHKAALAILLMGVVLNLKALAGIWPLFCAFGFCLFLKKERHRLFSMEGIAAIIPFLFSLISSVWFFAGVHDLRLLGYDTAWSFYAALHGSFLGWLFTGCLVFLSRRPHSGRLNLWGCYLSFIFFLFVAFGIDGIPYIKRVGVIGFSIMTPLLIALYAFNLRNERRSSRSLAALSLLSILASMTLAVLNEFWPAFPRFALGLPVMVLTHGLLNAIVAIPCFFLAIRLENESAQKTG